jgi:hypothetical protein
MPATALLPCTCRSASPVDYHGQPRYVCVHPRIAAGREMVMVRPEFCAECKYVGFDAEQLKQHYRPAGPHRPDVDEFAERVDKCDGCGSRIGNYCMRVGGNCSLITKLQKIEFACPKGEFGACER